MILHTHEEFQLKTEILLKNHQPAELSYNLKGLVIDYLEYELNEGCSKTLSDFQYLTDINSLCRWLEKVASETANENNSEPEDLFMITENFLDDHSPGHLHSVITRLLVSYMPHVLNQGYNYQFNKNLPGFMALLEWLEFSYKLLNISNVTSIEQLLTT